MNDADREIVERYQLLARPDDDGLVHTDHVEPLLSLIESQATEIERLKASLKSMEAAYVARANMQ